MTDTFDKRMAELAKKVGDGDLVGEVVVDQVYAKYQHEMVDLNHPEGGEAKYLSKPLQEKYERYYAAMAEDTLTLGPKHAMIEATEDLVGEVGRRAPIEEGFLRGSGSPRVYDNGHLVFEKPPKEPRRADPDSE